MRDFQALLSTSKEWQLCLVKPSFDRLDSAKVSLLENPLAEEGIFFWLFASFMGTRLEAQAG